MPRTTSALLSGLRDHQSSSTDPATNSCGSLTFMSVGEGSTHGGDHVAMVEHASAFPDAVHGPHRRADIDTRDTKARSQDGADGAAATEEGTVRVLLARHAGLVAQRHETGCRFGIGTVALVGVALDDRAGPDPRIVTGLVGRREIGVPAMRHVGTDEEAAGQHTVLVLGIQGNVAGEPGDDIGDEAAAGTGGTLAAHFLVIEKGAQAGCGRVGR